MIGTGQEGLSGIGIKSILSEMWYYIYGWLSGLSNIASISILFFVFCPLDLLLLLPPKMKSQSIFSPTFDISSSPFHIISLVNNLFSDILLPFLVASFFKQHEFPSAVMQKIQGGNELMLHNDVLFKRLPWQYVSKTFS